MEAPVEEDPAREVEETDDTTAEGARETRATNATTEETVVVLEDDPQA